MGMWNINTIDDDIKVPPKTAARVYFWARNALDKLKLAITPPQLHVFELLDGHKVTQCLCVAMRLGVADQRKRWPQGVRRPGPPSRAPGAISQASHLLRTPPATAIRGRTQRAG